MLHDRSSMGAAEAQAEAGRIIAGRYRVERVLGEGGMGRVLLARHIELGKRVAIKELRAERVRSETAHARFRREARAAVSILGEQVARILDFGVEDDRPYIVMEYVDGVDLTALLEASGPLAPERAVDYVLQACEALAEAHREGIVHRDLKPSNLRLTQRPDGSDLVKVLDFGIAKAIAEAGTLTQTASVLGTPRYMSPEQIRDAHDVDARSDLWSLGVVLYELVTGKPPFEAFTATGLVARITTDTPAPPREHRADLAPDLEAVILRCLEKEPAVRPPSVVELARALAPHGSSDAAVAADRIERIARRMPAKASAPRRPARPSS